MAPSTVGLILALALFTSSPSTCSLVGVHVQAFMQVAPSAALFAPSCNAQAHLSLALPSSSSSSSSSAEAEGVSFGGNDWQDGRCNVSIVYCTGCRWMLRSAYYAQELLTTFPDDLSSVTLIPSRPPLPGGMLIITLDGETIWNRKEQGQFPETKELKQLIRDVVAPERSLGHSDNIADDTSDEKSSVDKCDECDEAKAITGPIPGYISEDFSDYHTAKSPHVTIKYCTGCKWLLRAAWDAQEILTTFSEEINSVTFVPTCEPAGQFVVELDGKLIWDRAAEGRHAQPKELKQRIRDIISPTLDLGHSDVNKQNKDEDDESSQKDGDDDDAPSPFDDMDDDEAAEMRRLFGVM